MAIIIFSGLVLVDTMRVVDRGALMHPRLVVEKREPPDAMGTMGWQALESIPQPVFEALLLAAHVVV